MAETEIRKRPRRRKPRTLRSDNDNALSSLPSDFSDAATWRTPQLTTATHNLRSVMYSIKTARSIQEKKRVNMKHAVQPDGSSKRTAARKELSMSLPNLLFLREAGLLRVTKDCLYRSALPLLRRNPSILDGNPTLASQSLGALWPTLMLTRNQGQQLMPTDSMRDNAAFSRVCDLHHYLQLPWRPYAKRTILFSYLDTPPCDAVLGLSQDGSYLIAIGPARSYEPSMKLVLRVYGEDLHRSFILLYQH